MSITADSVKDDVKEVIQEVVNQVVDQVVDQAVDQAVEKAVEKAVPVLNIKIPELVAEIPEVIKDENVKKCLPSFNFVELFTSLMSGLTKKKKIITSV